MDLEVFKKLATVFAGIQQGFNPEKCQKPVNLLFGSLNHGKKFDPEYLRTAMEALHEDAAGLGGLENFNSLFTVA